MDAMKRGETLPRTASRTPTTSSKPPPRCSMRALARMQVFFDHADALEAAGLARRV
jgi:hypothetical protein